VVFSWFWYHYDDWYPDIALNSWHTVPTAHSGSSISISGVIRSQPGDFLGCSCFFYNFYDFA